MKGLKTILILCTLTFLTSCQPEKEDRNEEPIARALSNYLYASDLKGHIPSGLSGEDSLRIARRLTEEWIRNQLMVYQAELFLPDEQKDIEKQVEEYRSSLLIFKYKQRLIAENLDTAITEPAIRNYYEENSSNYILDKDMVRVTYVKIPAASGQVNRVRSLYRSDEEEALNELQTLCNETAEEFIINGAEWLEFTNLIARTPLNISDPSRYLTYNRNIETRDQDYYYFIHVKEVLREGEVKPLEMVRDNIKSVLLNKKRIEYIQELENSVYKEGVSRNQFEIY